jgi:hypothetical protein
MTIKKALEFLRLLFEWPWSGERAEMKRAGQVSLKANPA